MLENGYIKLNRSLVKWRWYKKQNTKDVFLHLLLIANYKDEDFEDITVKRGQIATSYKSIADATGVSEKGVRTAFDKLKSTGEIQTKRFSKFQLVTIVNYEKYQSDYQEITEEKTDIQRAVNGQSKGNHSAVNGQSKGNKERNKESKKARKQENIYRALDGKTENLRSAYLAFIEMRKQIKKPLTERALQIIIGKVEKLSSDTETQIAIINQSVEHCWQSVYELKDTVKAKDKKSSYDLEDFEKYTLQ